MALKFSKGIHFNDCIVLDKQAAKKHTYNIISHAHSDHVNLAGKSKIIATPETIELIKTNQKRDFGAIKLPYKKSIDLNDCMLSFHNAGHILGSAQVLLETKNESILYTGDFKLQDSLIEKKAEIIQADYLIIDSTYGYPAFSFPERKKVYNEMSSYINALLEKNYFIILAGYAYGKAQELTAFSNFYLNEKPIVHEKIFANNKVYEKFSVNIGGYELLNHNLDNASILIMPPSLVNHHLIQVLELSLHKKIATIFASGQNFGGFHKCFPLSDHASFDQLLSFVSEVKPKKVYTVYGYAKEFANAVRRKLKIPAKSLHEKGQSFLMEF